MSVKQLMAQGTAAFKAGNYDEAKGIFAKCLRANFDHAKAHYLMALTLEKLGNFATSEKAFKQAIKLAPDNYQFYANLGLLYEKTNKNYKAKASYIGALKAKNIRDNERFRMCAMLSNIGETKVARRFLPALTDETENDAILTYVEIYAQLGLRPHVIRAVKSQLNDNDTKDPEFWKVLGKACHRITSYDLKLECYLRELGDKSFSVEELAACSSIAIQNKDIKLARRYLEKISESDRFKTSAQFTLGQVLLLEGDSEQATQHFINAIRSDPYHFQSWIRISENASSEQAGVLYKKLRSVLLKAKKMRKLNYHLLYSFAHLSAKVSDNDSTFRSYTEANQFHAKALKTREMLYKEKKEEAESEYQMGLFETVAKNKAKPTGQDPIFIIGMPRSGTSLLEKILATYPNVDEGGENNALSRVLNEAHLKYREKEYPHPQDFSEDIWTKMAEDYWSLTPYSAPFVTDKMPPNYKAVGYALSMFPDAPIIYLQRDPRDVCVSIFTKGFPDTYNYAVDLEHTAHAYAMCDKVMKHWTTIAPDRILNVRYEDIVTNSEATTREIAKFCGLEWSPKCLEFYKSKSVTQTFSKHQVQQPLNSKGIGRWRDYEKHLGPMIAKLNEYGLLKEYPD